MRTNPLTNLARPLALLLLLGLYFTFKGYHSLDGDQAYRLPLLLHQLDPSQFADDPFVRAFDRFNPHRGALAVLGGLTRIVGLSPALILTFVATFVLTCRGIDRLARAAWPDSGHLAGWIAAGLVLIARAGNIGTNHLFESMLLDRLLALAFGWQALALLVDQRRHAWWQSGLVLAPAAIVHPSLGLQLGLLVSGGWIASGCLGRWSGVTLRQVGPGVLAAWLAVVPGLLVNVGLDGSGSLLEGLRPEDFWTITVELQSPQHMLPHAWRMPQWLAWAGYLVLAITALGVRRRSAESGNGPSAAWPPARVRLMVLLGLVVAWLGGSWVAIEAWHHLRITVFQPFRMATIARGLALVILAGRLAPLLSQGSGFDRARAVLMAVGLTGDWRMVVVTAAELAGLLGGWTSRRLAPLAYGLALLLGLAFLSRHDTESGHVPLLVTTLVLLAAAWIRPRLSGWFSRLPSPLTAGSGTHGQEPSGARVVPRAAVLVVGLAWVVPLLAWLAAMVPERQPLARTALVRGLVSRCRFAAVPVDDIERLALWCRDNTAPGARFIGPPGPKTFRLWSQRSLAFNRASSPYHAAGLADWFARFQAHVEMRELPAAFVRSYRAGRHNLEARYDRLGELKWAALALEQGADHVIAPAPAPALGQSLRGPLELLHMEGRFAAYRVRSEQISQIQR